MSFKSFVRTGLVAAAAIAVFAGAQATDISGAGATFPYPIYSKWAAAYKTETGDSLNYQSIGSGGGIKQIEARTVTFGATDKPLDSADLERMASSSGRRSSAASSRSSISTASPPARSLSTARPSPRSSSARSRPGMMRRLPS